MSSSWAKIVAVFSAGDPHVQGYKEALERLGLRVESTDNFNINDLNRTHVLLFCGRGTLKEADVFAIRKWISEGGQVVLGGSDWGLATAAGLQPALEHFSTGVATGSPEDRLWPNDVQAVRFFGAAAASTSSAESLASCRGKTLLSRNKVGRGQILFFGIHLGDSSLNMQMGRSVECDGIGPEDNSVKLDDGLLLAEDGCVIPWQDREEIDGKPVFLQANADVIREIWWRCIFEAIENSEHAIALPWFWPENAEFAATLTLECEVFDGEPTVAVHRQLAMNGVPAAWLVASPGYPNDVYRIMRAREHEIGVLFNLEEVNPWHEERLKSQMTQLQRLSSEHSLTSVRPSGGAWKGYNQFYEMCESAGVRLSASKGGRQAGNQGFAFGTCHPFFPFPNKSGNSYGLVMELPYHAFRPGIIAHLKHMPPLITQTKARHGVFHIVSTPQDFLVDHAIGIRQTLGNVKDEKAVWMNPKAIYQYEKGRRHLKIVQKSVGNELTAYITSSVDMPGFSLMLSEHFKSVTVNDKVVQISHVERFGMRFMVASWELSARTQYDLKAVANVRSEAA